MIDALPHIFSGKVRDIYEAGDDRLLMVTSDRISAFDVVMAEPVPDKGRVLTATSAFWFGHLADVVPSHLISTDLADCPEPARHADWEGRVMLCRRAEVLPVECIVRGYLTGSAWKEYRQAGTMHGTRLPDGLLESDRLPEPVFTPSTKAAVGDHDENISFARAVELLGADQAEQVREISLHLYRRGAAWAAERGVIIADTKFELGLVDGQIVVADEVLTPDSSRFWPADRWEPGTTPPSFDKQPVRDFLDGLDWDKRPPPPPLPPEVVAASRARYIEAYERVTGLSFADWPGAGTRVAAIDVTSLGWFDQHAYRARFDWGTEGMDRLAPVSDVVVIVDVLRFTTCVDVAVGRGAVVLPYRWADESAAAFALDQQAELAGWREDPATPWSLSPTDLASIPTGTRLVLPSPNGSALAFGAAQHGTAEVLAGCLRNPSAVAEVAGHDHATVAVIAAAEQARPAVEDLLGAGAVLAALADAGTGPLSPEALAAVAAFEAARGDLGTWLAGSASGRELVARGWADDVATAAALDVSTTAPVLREGAFALWPASTTPGCG